MRQWPSRNNLPGRLRLLPAPARVMNNPPDGATPGATPEAVAKGFPCISARLALIPLERHAEHFEQVRRIWIRYPELREDTVQ